MGALFDIDQAERLAAADRLIHDDDLDTADLVEFVECRLLDMPLSRVVDAIGAADSGALWHAIDQACKNAIRDREVLARIL